MKSWVALGSLFLFFSFHAYSQTSTCKNGRIHHPLSGFTQQQMYDMFHIPQFERCTRNDQEIIENARELKELTANYYEDLIGEIILMESRLSDELLDERVLKLETPKKQNDLALKFLDMAFNVIPQLAALKSAYSLTKDSFKLALQTANFVNSLNKTPTKAPNNGLKIRTYLEVVKSSLRQLKRETLSTEYEKKLKCMLTPKRAPDAIEDRYSTCEEEFSQYRGQLGCTKLQALVRKLNSEDSIYTYMGDLSINLVNELPAKSSPKRKGRFLKKFDDYEFKSQEDNLPPRLNVNEGEYELDVVGGKELGCYIANHPKYRDEGLIYPHKMGIRSSTTFDTGCELCTPRVIAIHQTQSGAFKISGKKIKISSGARFNAGMAHSNMYNLGHAESTKSVWEAYFQRGDNIKYFLRGFPLNQLKKHCAQ